MKTPSVQARLTLWYTLLMAGMGGLLLGFLVLISGTVSTQTAMDQLEATLRRNLSQITQGADGAPQLGEEFAFYDNGVYTISELIADVNAANIARQEQAIREIELKMALYTCDFVAGEKTE